MPDMQNRATTLREVPAAPAFFAGAVSLEEGDGWMKPWRLPFAERLLYPSPDEGLLARAEMPAGVRVRFRTDAAAVGLRCVPAAADRLFDLTQEGERLETVRLPAGQEDVLFESLAPPATPLEVWLPQQHPTAVRALLCSPGAGIEPAEDTRFRWVTYGSSISHCGAAHSPSRTWPGCVAREMGWSLTCLGFGGQCHLDPMVARVIRDLPADFISLKLGINVQGGSTLSPRTFRPAIIGMVQTIREKHPQTPIAVISPIISPPRETVRNAVGLSLSMMRAEAQDAVERLVAMGDRHLAYISGLDLFGEDLVADYLPDQLHPNGDGYQFLAANFALRYRSMETWK